MRSRREILEQVMIENCMKHKGYSYDFAKNIVYTEIRRHGYDSCAEWYADDVQNYMAA